jgi:hypothetical protein
MKTLDVGNLCGKTGLKTTCHLDYQTSRIQRHELKCSGPTF